MLQLKRKKHIRWGAILGFILVLIILGVTIASVVTPKRTSKNSNSTKQTSKQQEQPKVSVVSSRILFTGNTFWGRSVEEWSMASTQKYAFAFARLNELKRSEYEAWISGLECPMKASVHMTALEQEQNLQFNCSPDFLPEAKKYFTAFTLANNHTDNQGADGFAETKKHLDNNGIQYFGHYDPTKTDDACDVISLPVKATYNDGSKKDAKLPVALCGFHGVFQIPPQSTIDQISQYAKVMPVFAMPHMGAEYTPAPDQIKTDVYRRLIDAGADVILGDHPHWIQSTESYKGRLIVYSMGNFMFDQQDTLEVTRSAAIRVSMSLTKGSNLEKWLEVGKNCASYKDDCLGKIELAGLKKLPIEYKFGVVGTRDDQRQTHLATAAEQAAILQRLGWQATMTKLEAPYSAEK